MPLAAEQNLAKRANFLFIPAHTAKHLRVRSTQWVDTNEAGQKVIRRIEVSTVYDHQTLTTSDWRMLLTLERTWWDRPLDERTGLTPVHFRDLARAMGISWGRKTRQALKESLLRLRHVPILWKSAFFSAKTNRWEGPGKTNTILAELVFYDRYTPLAANNPPPLTDGFSDPRGAVVWFRLDPWVVENLLAGHVKPIFYGVVMGLRGEVAISLYSFLDVVMSRKTYCEWRSRELFEKDLFVRGTYRWPSDRRRILLRAKDELEGQPISTGALKLAVLKTKDREDYKLAVTKEAFPEREAPSRWGSSVPALGRREPLTERQKYLVDEILAVTGDEHSRRYYELVVSQVREPRIFAMISETKQARLGGEISTTPAKFFTDLAERELGRRQ